MILFFGNIVSRFWSSLNMLNKQTSSKMSQELTNCSMLGCEERNCSYNIQYYNGIWMPPPPLHRRRSYYHVLMSREHSEWSMPTTWTRRHTFLSVTCVGKSRVSCTLNKSEMLCSTCSSTYKVFITPSQILQTLRNMCHACFCYFRYMYDIWAYH